MIWCPISETNTNKGKIHFHVLLRRLLFFLKISFLNKKSSFCGWHGDEDKRTLMADEYGDGVRLTASKC